MKTCRRCGGECRDGAVFCEFCGGRFDPAPDTAEAASSTPTDDAVNGDVNAANGDVNAANGDVNCDVDAANDGVNAEKARETCGFVDADEKDAANESSEKESADGDGADGGKKPIADAASGITAGEAANERSMEKAAERSYREARKKRMLDAATAPAFIVLCVAELMALLAGIFVNLTAKPGSTVSIPLLSIFFCLAAWMIFLSAKNRKVVPEGWLKFLRVLSTVLCVLSWTFFGILIAFALTAVAIDDGIYAQLWQTVESEAAASGVDISDLKDASAMIGISLKWVLVTASCVGSLFLVIYAIFFGKLKRFFRCVMREARGSLPGVYPSGVAGFCWFYVMCGVFGLCVTLLSPPYNVFTLITYAADITAAVALALTVARVADNRTADMR